MNNRILEQLEFDKVKQLFAGYLQTEQGQDELRKLEPMTEPDRISRSFDEMSDMEQIFIEHHSFGMGSLRDISESMRRLELDADVNISEIIDIKKVLQVSAEIKHFYNDLENVELSALNTLFEKIELLPSLQGSLQAINDGGFIENFASSELDRIRRQINHDEGRVRQILQDILKKQADHLTETLIASRNGRAVLPVKNSYRNRISGVVHDISASGSTVYIEPRAVVQLNEEITQLRADERHEMARILRELSNMLRPHTNIIRNNAWVLGHLDFVRAKFLFMQENNAIVPQLSADKTVQLLQARHPLLTDPVANDLHFLDELTVIVITGPNTGGKTVMLKTLGLAQLMAQSGLPILADKGSKVAVFNEIFADIGDEQSIEQSLSTFSSHMTNIVSILKDVTENSLVIFDELGAGTDPIEGAALAIAILEDVAMAGARCIATTHYTEIKNYALTKDGVENAAVEFDLDTLSPTYKLLIGVPGKSNAFEISKKLGLSDYIITRAKEFIDTDNIELEDILQSAEKNRIKAEEERIKAEKLRESIEKLKIEYDEKLEKFANQKEKMLEQARRI